jgi:hypothetical protein
VGDDAAGFVELHWDGAAWTQHRPAARPDEVPVKAFMGAVALPHGQIWAVATVADAGGIDYTWPTLLHGTGSGWAQAADPHPLRSMEADAIASTRRQLWIAAHEPSMSSRGQSAFGAFLARWRWDGWDVFGLPDSQIVLGLGDDRRGGLWAVGLIGSDWDAEGGFPTTMAPLVKHGTCR